MKPTRPIVRYHGGKWKLAPWILSHFPEHRVYTETFGGGASVLLRKSRSYAEVYNDLDGELVNLFRIARDFGKDLERIIGLTPFAKEEFKLSYQSSSDSLEQARRTVVRSFMGFGSNAHNMSTGFRACSNRSGTTPAHDWMNYPKALNLIVDRLRGVVIENRDSKEVMLAHDGPKTLHYVDPPYVASARNKGSDYRFEMDDAMHRDLAVFLKNLKGMVVVSGYPSPLYDDIFSGWATSSRAALADGAKKRTEVLWMRNVPNDYLL